MEVHGSLSVPKVAKDYVRYFIKSGIPSSKSRIDTYTDAESVCNSRGDLSPVSIKKEIESKCKNSEFFILKSCFFDVQNCIDLIYRCMEEYVSIEPDTVERKKCESMEKRYGASICIRYPVLSDDFYVSKSFTVDLGTLKKVRNDIVHSLTTSPSSQIVKMYELLIMFEKFRSNYSQCVEKLLKPEEFSVESKFKNNKKLNNSNSFKKGE